MPKPRKLTILLAVIAVAVFVAWILWRVFDLKPVGRTADLFIMAVCSITASVGMYLVYDIWE